MHVGMAMSEVKPGPEARAPQSVLKPASSVTRSKLVERRRHESVSPFLNPKAEEWMLSMSRVRKNALALTAAVCTTLILASTPAWAQDAAAADPNPGALTITGSVDFLNQYMFRGIQQNNTGFVTWPAFDLGLAAYSGDGGLKSVGINFGTWNSLHSGNTGSDGPSGKMWYESDFYATLGLGFGGGTSFSTTYTAYTSPNSGFTTVKEIAFKFGFDDSGVLGKAPLSRTSSSRRSSALTSAPVRLTAARTRALTWRLVLLRATRRAGRASRFRSSSVSA